MNNSPEVPSTAQDTPSSAPQPSAFERWRRKAMLVTGLGVTDDERLEDLRQHHIRDCERKKEYLMNYSPVVVFMLKHLKASGCEVPMSNVLCAPCDMSKAGGFTPDPGAVILCAGHFFSQQHMESTITHELMHMYDHCRFKVDWANLRHHACSEIRANNLSGDCRFTRELRRGFLSFSKQHQACVRRRAVESVTANPACPNEAAAERAVNEVWESCFNDTRPFDESTPTSLIPVLQLHDSAKMFSKLALLSAVVAPLASALTLNIPTNPTSGGNVTITWSSAPNDPETFSFELVNTAFHNSFAIANNVNPTAESLTLTLPIVPVGDGYSLEAVDVGNITNVFASTGTFAIGASTASFIPSSTSSGASVTSALSSTPAASGASSLTPVSSPSGLSSNIVSPSSTAPSSSSSGSALPSTTPFNSAVSFRAGLGNSAGGFAAVILSAIAGAALLAF